MHTHASSRRSFARTTLYLTGGLLIWAANFLVTYVFAAVACARGFTGAWFGGIGVVSVATLVSCAVAVALNAWLFRHAWVRYRAQHRQQDCSRTDEFIDFVAAAIAGLSIVAVVWTAFVAALPPTC